MVVIDYYWMYHLFGACVRVLVYGYITCSLNVCGGGGWVVLRARERKDERPITQYNLSAVIIITRSFIITRM